MSDLRVRLCGIELASPLLNGSGTLDALAAGTLGLAGYVTKTVTLNAREGNAPQRIGPGVLRWRPWGWVDANDPPELPGIGWR